MHCAIFQFDVRTDDPDSNLERVAAASREAAGRGVELLLLPELWSLSFVAHFGAAQRAAVAHCRRELARLSSECGLALAGSSHAPGEEGQLPANRFELYADGERLAYHDKVHLFSPTAEQLAFRAGQVAPPVFALAGALLSGLVCYDLRFAELCRAPIRAGAELLLVCAQWPRPRASHWRALIMGRAVEGQCFVIAANRCGRALVGRRQLELHYPGNSLIVGPDGVVRAEGQGQEGLVSFDCDLEEVREQRRRIPVLRDERRELYRQW